MKTQEKIRLARKQKGLTQESLANASNLSLSTIQRIEKGKVIPRLHTLKILSEILEIELLSDQPITENASKSPNDLPLILSLTSLLVFIPPFNVFLLLGILLHKRSNGLVDFTLEKILTLQVISFVILLLVVLLIPFCSFLLTGQKAVGQINLPFFAYLCFVMTNIVILFSAFQEKPMKQLKAV